MQKILCPEEVAEILHLSRSTVYKLLRQQEIPAVQIQRQYRILESELEKWLLSHIDCKIEIDD